MLVKILQHFNIFKSILYLQMYEKEHNVFDFFYKIDVLCNLYRLCT